MKEIGCQQNSLLGHRLCWQRGKSSWLHFSFHLHHLRTVGPTQEDSSKGSTSRALPGYNRAANLGARLKFRAGPTCLTCTINLGQSLCQDINSCPLNSTSSSAAGARKSPLDILALSLLIVHGLSTQHLTRCHTMLPNITHLSSLHSSHKLGTVLLLDISRIASSIVMAQTHKQVQRLCLRHQVSSDQNM